MDEPALPFTWSCQRSRTRKAAGRYARRDQVTLRLRSGGAIMLAAKQEEASMGWASGYNLMNAVIASVKREFPTDHASRKRLYLDLIEAFEGHDWDTQQECLGKDFAFDEAMCEVHPDMKVQDEDAS